MIFANFGDYGILDGNKINGAYMTNAICKVLEYPNKIKNISLRELIIAIRRQTKIGIGEIMNQQASQLVVFEDGLEYKVYFNKYIDNDDLAVFNQIDD